MVHIPGGTFMMGCSPGDPDCEDNEKPSHRVTVSGFWMDSTLVTQVKYQTVTGSNPSHFSDCADCPVVNVTWDEATSYCARVGKRLPTEAEWEFAARGGTLGARYGDLDAIAWYKANSGDTSHPVGQKRPNAYGLYDMLGNVWEWCADWYDANYYMSSPSDNPKGPSSGPGRVRHGGSRVHDPGKVRVSFRDAYGPSVRFDDRGFRCVRD
jgi:formylglycine-generating enzyme required for sulfatase activity